MNSSRILKLILIAEIVFLLSNALALTRDHQDSWVLEGLEIPFVIFVATYAVTFFSEKRITWMVALATICRYVFALIPNFKYVWFLGRNIDQHVQYSLANYVCSEGRILPNQYWGTGATMFYSNTPFIHLSFASFSILTGIPLVYSFKFLPVFLSSIYPLLTYAIIKKLRLVKETTVLRYALFVSSLPIDSALSYIVTGSMFGVLFSFFVLLQVIRLLEKDNRSDLLILTLFSFALVTAHSFSSLQLALLIVGIMFLQKLSSLRIKPYLRISTVLLILLVTLGWFAFQALGTLRYMTERVVNIGVLLGIYPSKGYIPVRFFELAYVNIFDALKTILASYGADAFLLLLTLTSLVFVTKNRKWSNRLKFLCLFSVLLWLLLVAGVLSGIATFYWKRIVRFLSISYAVFFGIFMVHIGKRRIHSAVAVSLLATTMVLATIESYHCQPIIIPANAISRNLPADEPILYVVQVNSIYQREMIGFAEDYVNGLIACDGVTRNQIIGLTELDFPGTLVWFYPFSVLLDENISPSEYDYFLIHLPGKSGAFEEQAEIRTRSLILNAINNSSIVYTNGESYVLVSSSDGVG